MRVQGAGLFWLLGLAFVFAAWWLTTRVASRAWRNQLRALVMGLGLGVALVPGHDVLILAPSTQLMLQGLRDTPDAHLRLLLGAAFFALTWMAALLSLSLWRPRVATPEVPAAPAAPQVIPVSPASF